LTPSVRTFSESEKEEVTVPKTTIANRSSKTTSAKSPKTKVTKSPKPRGVEKVKTPDDEVTVDRRRGERRTAAETPAEKPIAPAPEEPKADKPVERRVKVPRRRQIDPTTCERDYTNEEIEFMHALDNYKRANGRMFPTCSEILEVIRNLGYAKPVPQPTDGVGTSAEPSSKATSAEVDPLA
jgi:hypothetical protein